MITGLLDFVYRKPYFAIVMTLAGLFGLASAILVEYDEYLSAVMGSVSVHLFVVDAIEAIFWREKVGAGSVDRWLKCADLSFLVATLLDVILSYFLLAHDYCLYGTDLVVVAILAAVLWLLTAIIYVGTTIHVRRYYKSWNWSLPESIEGSEAVKSDISSEREKAAPVAFLPTEDSDEEYSC